MADLKEWNSFRLQDSKSDVTYCVIKVGDWVNSPSGSGRRDSQQVLVIQDARDRGAMPLTILSGQLEDMFEQV
jgi:hypothetical protein